MPHPEPVPFKIDVNQDTLDWVTQRIKTARVIPDAVQNPEGKEWEDGTPSSSVKDLVDFWRDEYDWRKVEARLNSTFQMYTVDIEEGGEVINLHFAHHPSPRKDAIPLLFAHGWPSNFTEVENLFSLTAPEDSKKQAFHLIAPSIPGFVFSSGPKRPGFGVSCIAEVYHKLMLKLGYKTYIGQGGDWGAMILRGIAQRHPESCVGIHLNMIISLPPAPLPNPLPLLYLMTRWLNPEEKKRLERLQWWSKKETGYFAISGTKPQTISYGLMDSPVGMLAWIREKLEILVEPAFVWDKELLITWTMLYLLSGSAFNARIYKEAEERVKEEILDRKIPATVAFGASMFPYEIGYVPVWWAKATVAENIIFWKEHQKGGHFPAVERADDLKNDIWEFVKRFSETHTLALQVKN